MTNALVAMNDMQTMAQAFAKSGLFGTKTPDQCLALMLMAHAEGVHPAIAMRDFDVIQGRPSKKAEAMQRSFLAAGGKIEWHKYEDSGAAATFSHPQGGTLRIDWDEARAKKAGLSAKDMYGKYARQMYGSRVISEGCRRVYPASTSGLYVPEEVRAFGKEEKRLEKDMGPAEIAPEAPESIVEAPKEDLQGKTKLEHIETIRKNTKISLESILKKCGVATVDALSDTDFAAACAMLRAKAA